MEKDHAEDCEKRLPCRCGARFDVRDVGAFAGRLLRHCRALCYGPFVPYVAPPPGLLPDRGRAKLYDVRALCAGRDGRRARGRALPGVLHRARSSSRLQGPLRIGGLLPIAGGRANRQFDNMGSPRTRGLPCGGLQDPYIPIQPRNRASIQTQAIAHKGTSITTSANDRKAQNKADGRSWANTSYKNETVGTVNAIFKEFQRHVETGRQKEAMPSVEVADGQMERSTCDFGPRMPP
jgi:hypothetical protein